jgi:hypothetical protein
MVALRLDPRLQGRVDASDVIQDGYPDAMRRPDEFIRDPSRLESQSERDTYRHGLWR